MIWKKAYAKVNLVLDVLGKRSDGYHELAGIMHSIDLCDEVGVMPTLFSGISVNCTEQLPSDNTATRAASAYMKAAGIDEGLEIVIRKRIPSQAGLGGASADAAAVLLALQEVYENAVCVDELFEIGKGIGADVPFCMNGGCAYVCGIGEKIHDMPAQKLYMLLIMGGQGISTKMLFDLHDRISETKNVDVRLEQAIKAIGTDNRSMLLNSLFNTLESTAFHILPELETVKKRLLHETGAQAALMTGSGSVMYGVYDSRCKAEMAAKRMNEFGYEFVYVAETIAEEFPWK